MKMFILHGWTYEVDASWKPLLEMLRVRGVDFEFLRIPGLTDGTDPVWTLDDYVEWLKQRTVVEEKVILYGHSNGGRISLAFAAKYPEKVEKLILEDSAGIPPYGVRKLKRDVFRMIVKIGGAVTRNERMRSIFYKLVREQDYQRASANMRATMANLVSVDLTDTLSRISVPTFIIWGRGDTTTPLKNGMLMNSKIHGSQMLVIPDARHSPHITHPEKVVRAITDFIA